MPQNTMGFKGHANESPFLKSLKRLVLLLGLGILSLLASGFGLGSQCLAGSQPSRYVFWLKDPTPFMGRVSFGRVAQFQLMLRDQSWRLELTEEPRDVSRMALEEYQLLAYRTGQSNMMPLADWIINFDPFVFKNKDIARIVEPKNADVKDFVEAWDSFRTRFMSELEAFQQELKRRGYSKTAEIFFSQGVVRGGVKAALSDLDFHARIRSALSEALQRRLTAYPMEFDELIDVPIFKNSGRARMQASLMVNPVLALEDLKIDFDPVTEKHDETYRVQLGRLKISLPLHGMTARILDLSLSAQELKVPVRILPSDAVELSIDFDQHTPIELDAEVLWDKILQRPELKVSRNSLKTPLASAKLKSVSYQGHRFESGNGSITGWMAENALLSLLQGSINDGHLLEDLVIGSVDSLQSILAHGLEINLDLVAIENLKGDSTQPVALEVFQMGNPRHEPALNKSMIARFQFKLPLKIVDPHGDLTADSQENILKGRFKVGLLDPTLEVENIQLFWQGERLQSNQLGLRAQLKNRLSPVTQIETGATIKVQDDLHFDLDPVEAKLQGLSVSGIDIRMGNHWLKGRQPSFDMIVENIDQLRTELLTSRSQNKMGIRIQEWVESQITSEMNKRLTNLKLPFDIVRTHRIQKFGLDALGYLRTSGEFRVDSIPVQDVGIRFRDLQKSKPKCQGTYLTSAEAHIGLSEPVNLRSSPLSIEVGLDRYKSTIDAMSVMAMTVPGQETYLDFVFDVCLLPARENLDIQVRQLRHNLSQVQVAGVQIFGLSTRNEVLQQVPELSLPDQEDGGVQMTSDLRLPGIKSLIETGFSLYGTRDGAEKDAQISKFIERIVKQNHYLLGDMIKSGMTDFVKERVPYYLNSPPVKSQLERFIIELRGVEEKVGELMFNIGELIQQPLNQLLSEVAGSYVKEILPKAKKVMKSQQSILDRLIVGFGQVAAIDLDMTAYSLLVRLVYGPTSFDRLSVDLERLMKPSDAASKIRTALGFASEPSPLSRAGWVVPYHRILQVLSRCPYSADEWPRDELEEILGRLDLSASTKVSIYELIDEVCWEDESGAPRSRHNVLNEWFGEGIGSLNAALMDRAIASYFKITAS